MESDLKVKSYVQVLHSIEDTLLPLVDGGLCVRD